jgi:hypothetical protein
LTLLIKLECIASFDDKNVLSYVGFVKKRDLSASKNSPKIPPKREDLRDCDTFSERGHFDLSI